ARGGPAEWCPLDDVVAGLLAGHLRRSRGGPSDERGLLAASADQHGLRVGPRRAVRARDDRARGVAQRAPRGGSRPPSLLGSRQGGPQGITRRGRMMVAWDR